MHTYMYICTYARIKATAGLQHPLEGRSPHERPERRHHEAAGGVLSRAAPHPVIV